MKYKHIINAGKLPVMIKYMCNNFYFKLTFCIMTFIKAMLKCNSGKYRAKLFMCTEKREAMDKLLK